MIEDGYGLEDGIALLEGCDWLDEEIEAEEYAENEDEL